LTSDEKWGGQVLKITHVKLGSSGATPHTKRALTICVELAKPHEFMTITVSIPTAGSERDACECGIARAKDFARHFADVPLQYFPLPAPRLG
jgi:hypothetical protein